MSNLELKNIGCFRKREKEMKLNLIVLPKKIMI